MQPAYKRVRVWREVRQRNRPQNINEQDAFQGEIISAWAGISFSYRTSLQIFRRGFVTVARYSDEVLGPNVTLYATVFCPAFVLINDNVRL